MEILKDFLIKKFPGVDFELAAPPSGAAGDYATNIAFALTKPTSGRAGESPRRAAEKVAEVLGGLEIVAKAEIAGAGFVNIFLKDEFLQSELVRIAGNPEYGASKIGGGKTVIVEYPSTNIAKPMHYGHSRSPFIGDALANVYEILGYKVIRWDYLGDWGTQFGKLLAAYKMWGSREQIDREPIASMLALYVKFVAEAKNDPTLDARAREEFKKLEDGDEENRKLWEWFRAESLKESHEMYRLLQLKPLDTEIGESFFEAEMKPLVQDLLERRIAERSEGAVIVRLDDKNLPPALLQKSDGSSLYLTRDIALLRYRIAKYHPIKILHAVANQQALHFEQLFALAEKLGLTEPKSVHVKFGMILGENGKKLASREGAAVLMAEVVEEATERAEQIIFQKHPDLPSDEQKNVAQAVAIGALKYNDLKQHPHTDIIFNWETILDFNGDSGPYLQYTYARLASILRKADLVPKAGGLSLAGPDERILVRHLLDFPNVIQDSAELYALNGLARYLYELAAKANQFYEHVRILDDQDLDRRANRLVLVVAVAQTLKRGLEILGIRALERI